jgi:hypothetical protein
LEGLVQATLGSDAWDKLTNVSFLPFSPISRADCCLNRK